MRLHQLAISSVSTRHAGLEEPVDACSAAGFREVEFHLPMVKAWLAEGRTTADVVGVLESNGLKAIGGVEPPILRFGSDEAIADNHRHQRENAALIHGLGGGTLVIWTDWPLRPWRRSRSWSG